MPKTVNKVVLGSEVLLDLTADTVTPAALMQGYTAHDASGAAIVGTSTAGTMVIRDTQDSHGGTVREITAGSVVTGTRTITANGTYDVAEYADALVDVPSAEPELQAKTATPTESQQTVTPDTGYDGLSSVTVGAISSTYVGSGITRRSSTDLTASGATVTVPSGYYSAQASKAVSSGTAGTPTATKGTVSNHSVSVTPSVTNTTGYITGGTKSGTAVTVSASELVSGTYAVSASGTHDVTNYASASVAAGGATASATKGSVSNHSVTVTPSVTRTAGYVTAGTADGTAVTVSASELVSGSQTITENGTYDVTEYAGVEVSVAGASSTRTATISRSDGQSYPRVQVNGTGTTYSANEEQFTWEDGDTLRFFYGSSDYYGLTYVNGVLIHNSTSGGYYTYTPPKCDIGIQFVRNTSQEYAHVYITYPQLEITSSGVYDVSDYCSVTVDVPSGLDEFKAMVQRTANVITDLPSDITKIGDGAFYLFSSLALTSLPSGVTSIGNYAFYNCNLLRLSSLPSGLTTIGQHAFYACSNLTFSSLPSSLTSLGQYAFYNCNGLTQMDLSATAISSIASYTFASCHNLASVSIPSTVTSIATYAFNGCNSLTSVSCNGAIATLGGYSFTGYSTFSMQLERVSFPNAVISSLSVAFGATTAANACRQLETADIGSTSAIAANAFANCYKLQTLVLRKTASICTLNNVSAFLNTPMRGYNSLTGTVYVPSALISSYQTATNWSTLYNDGTVTFVAIEGSDYEI